MTKNHTQPLRFALAAHTPTPWQANYWATGWTVSAPESHYSICHLEDCNNADNNAAFIVRAVNSHQVLVDALIPLLRDAEMMLPNCKPTIAFLHGAHAHIAQARAALAQATEDK